jgi:hypothetical protein
MPTLAPTLAPTRRVPRRPRRTLARAASLLGAGALALSLTAGAQTAQAAPGTTVKAPAAVVAQIADTLEVEARCLKVRQARSWRAWAWVAPNYRIGCDHQLDTAMIFAKQVDGTFADTGIEGAPLVCDTLKRQMSLYVEDDEPKIGKRTIKAYRNFKAAGYCVKE